MSAVIRLVRISDTESLLNIYAPYIKETSITFEYEVPSIQEFEKRIADISERFPWLVCEQDGVIAGYAYASPHHTRAAYQWDVESSVYIAPPFHGLGIASKLYRCLITLLAEQGYYHLYTLITVPNEQSIGFHLSQGFHPLGTYPKTGYKFHAWHDVIIMEKEIRRANNAITPTVPILFNTLEQSFVNDILNPS